MDSIITDRRRQSRQRKRMLGVEGLVLVMLLVHAQVWPASTAAVAPAKAPAAAAKVAPVLSPSTPLAPVPAKPAPAPALTPAAPVTIAPVKAPVASPPPHLVPAVAPTVKPKAPAPAVAPATPTPAASPRSSPAPALPPAAPSPTVASPAVSPASPAVLPPAALPISNITLDPKQVAALRSLGLVVGADACSTQPTTVLQCDNGKTVQHVLGLSLQNCPPTAVLTQTALASLSTLHSLSFYDCPMSTVPMPQLLADSLTSFSCTASLGPTATHKTAQGLPGWWLGRMHNVEELTVLDVQVHASSLDVIVSNLNSLQQFTMQSTNLTGPLPTSWPSKKIKVVDLANNDLTGTIPLAISHLTSLERLDLSANRLSGHMSNTLGDLVNLQTLSLSGNLIEGRIPSSLAKLASLTHLDLSFNRLNDTIPDAVGLMPLEYLDLRNNSLSGAIPFTDLFIKQLKTFRIDGNPDLCYNNTLTSAKVALGLPPCGLVAPSPSPNYLSPTLAPDQAASPETGASGGKHKKKPKAVVVVFSVFGALAVVAGIVYCCCRWFGSRD